MNRCIEFTSLVLFFWWANDVLLDIFHLQNIRWNSCWNLSRWMISLCKQSESGSFFAADFLVIQHDWTKPKPLLFIQHLGFVYLLVTGLWGQGKELFFFFLWNHHFFQGIVLLKAARSLQLGEQVKFLLGYVVDVRVLVSDPKCILSPTPTCNNIMINYLSTKTVCKNCLSSGSVPSPQKKTSIQHLIAI